MLLTKIQLTKVLYISFPLIHSYLNTPDVLQLGNYEAASVVSMLTKCSYIGSGGVALYMFEISHRYLLKPTSLTHLRCCYGALTVWYVVSQLSCHYSTKKADSDSIVMYIGQRCSILFVVRH